MDRGKRLRIARLELENAHAAVDSLPVIEERARARVADAQARLDAEQAELTRVLEVEIPATLARVAELEAEIAELEGA